MGKKKETAEVKVEETGDVSPEKKIEQINAELTKFEESSVVFLEEIKTEEQYQQANDFIVQIKARLKKISATETKYVQPFKDALKNLQDSFSSSKNGFEQIEKMVKNSMSKYKLEQDRIQREQEAEARKQREIEAEKQKKIADDAKKKGEKPPVPVPASTPVNFAPKPSNTVASDGGRSTASKSVKFEIVDANSLPKKCRDMIFAKAVEKGIANTIIRPFMKLGLEVEKDGDTGEVSSKISGVRVWEEFDISVTIK